jgi:hypothetical protein
MRLRAMAGALVVTGLALGMYGTGSAAAVTRCTWAGTPQAPTGTFTLRPGITDLPAPGPLAFKATGVMGGDPVCGTGTVSFVGQADAGSSCENAAFEGTVRGLPGVTRFWGKGPGVDIPSLLYNATGQVVGLENAELFTQSDLPHTVDCSRPGGFTGGWPGMFSSTIVLFDR